MRVRRRGFALLRVLIGLVSLTLAVSPAALAERVEQGRSRSPIILENENIAVRANEWGQYTIGTHAGDPATPDDDGRRLMYGHGGLAFTSFTTLRLVSGGETRDEPLLRNSDPQPEEVNGALRMGWSFEGVSITQTLTPSINPYTDRPDTVRIALNATNTTQAPISAGLRIMFDTMIGDNDRAPFFVPGSGNFDVEREFSGDEIPAYWKAFEAHDYDSASLKGQGILTGQDATTPDRLVFATWPNIKNTAWDYEVNPARSVGDSAVAMYWEPVDLAPGASVTWVTYYGLAGVGGGNAWIDAPVSITSDQPEFNATLWVANFSDADFTGGEATIVLPEGMRLAAGETERKSMPSVPVNGGAQSVTWRLVGEGSANATYPYSATVSFESGSGPLSADASVEYRFIAPSTLTPTLEPTATPTATNTPVPPAVAPIAPAPTEPEGQFPWWLLLLPLLLLPLLLLLLKRQPSRPASPVAPPRVARSAPPPDFTERKVETGPLGANVTHGRKKTDSRDPNENPLR